MTNQHVNNSDLPAAVQSHNIGLRNGILTAEHRERMGMAIWLYSWLIFKMTVVDNGTGKVLGGKPIRFEDVAADLGITRATYSRWLEILQKYGYVVTLRTPYGLVFTITKAKKDFKKTEKRFIKNETSLPSDVSEMQHPDVSEMIKEMPKNETSNKDKIEDKINNYTQVFEDVKNIIQPKARYSTTYAKQIKKALATLSHDELVQTAQYFANKFNGSSQWHSKPENQKYKTLAQFFGGNKDRVPRYELNFEELQQHGMQTSALPRIVADEDIEVEKAQQNEALKNLRKGVTA